ncbi:MAG: hypothetical protein RL434_106 [Pseudomonadota bacterium]|jgi:hypothetical protein
MSFNLEKFEHLAYTRQHELAARELLSLLADLDANYGMQGGSFAASPLTNLLPAETDVHIWTRVASAISCLFADADFAFSPDGFAQLLNFHRWFSAIFSATPFRNADHVVRAFNIGGKGDLSHLQVENRNLAKFCLLYSPESEIALDLDALWEHDKRLAAGLCLALLSPRFLGAPAAHIKRELMLPWLARKLDQIEDIAQLPVGILHDVYMHCSYADIPEKHDIKKPINALIRRWLASRDLHDIAPPEMPRKREGKPVLLAVMEWFNAGHSIYRTHSRTLEGARRHFHVIGMGFSSAVDEAGKAIFDEFIEIEGSDTADQLRCISQVAREKQADILYMPSVGMFPLTMFLANLRVAPVQAMALGHPATSHSSNIDYVVVEEDYVGDPACFSEKLLILPRDGMPYRPSAAAASLKIKSSIRKKPDVVRIAVASTTMKLNPRFLMACARIASEAKSKVHFHFLIGQAQGLTYPQVQRVVSQYLGDVVTVYPHQPYADYMKVIEQCDLFINPFPFGNTNGIIDTITAGLVGINKTGREVHEHIDQGLFERLGCPDWMTARTVDEYVTATVRLVDDHELRGTLRRTHAGPDKVQCLFQGRPEILGDLFLDAVAGPDREEASAGKALRRETAQALAEA